MSLLPLENHYVITDFEAKGVEVLPSPGVATEAPCAKGVAAEMLIAAEVATEMLITVDVEMEMLIAVGVEMEVLIAAEVEMGVEAGYVRKHKRKEERNIMSVYVDNARLPFRRMLVCHMTADTLDELHEMAQIIGIKRQWFQNKSIPHYDICLSKRILAVQCGAIEETTRETVARKWKAQKRNRNGYDDRRSD